MKKTAFTMIEFVFIIVVIGIISASIIPQFDRDRIGEAAHQVARHIRLAQHYAMMEDRFNDGRNGADWRETYWRIRFENGTDGDCYWVFADRDGGGNADSSERAVDPLTKKWVWGDSTCSDSNTQVNQDVLLWKKFGVTGVQVCAANNPKHIAFDNLGRPLQVIGSIPTYLAADCDVAITTDDGNAVVRVYRETGYVKVYSIDGAIL